MIGFMSRFIAAAGQSAPRCLVAGALFVASSYSVQATPQEAATQNGQPPTAGMDQADFPLIADTEWSCVMAGQETEIRFVDLRTDREQLVDWTLSKEYRTLARGKSVSQKDSDGAELSAIRFSIPESDSDVVIELTLELQFENEGKPESLKKTLFVYSAIPFVQKNALVKLAEIRLFDPVGDTKTLFDENSISFKSLSNLQSIDALNEGLVIVGEGVRLDRYRGLGNSLAAAVARGLDVLCLAPGDGSLEFETHTENRCSRVLLDRELVIQKYDKRFDTNSWLGESCIKTKFELSQYEGLLKVDCSEEGTAWPWIELAFDNSDSASGATMIVCGFGIVRNRDHGPVARHLLSRIIEEIESKN